MLMLHGYPCGLFGGALINQGENEMPRRRLPPAEGKGRIPVPLRASTCLILVFIQLLVCAGGPQVTSTFSQVASSEPSAMGQRVGQSAGPFGENSRDPFQEEKRLRALNADRQKTMVRDTEKLQRLATELKTEIDKEEPASLTPEEMRKWAEIEKLARSVKEKMSTSVRMPSTFPVISPGQFPN